MLKRFCLYLLIPGAIACHSAKKVATTDAAGLTKAQKKDGWQPLFDGATKKGWHIFNNRTDGAAWKVEEGVLFLDPKAKGPNGENGGELITDSIFENFHLKLDWKLDAGGNSGVMFLAKEDPKYRWAFVTGPEMQIIDNDKHDDAKYPKHRAGDLYDIISGVPENVKPIGEWNQVEIVLNKGKLDLFQNGAKIVSTQLWDDNWKALVQNSKFKGVSDFAAFHEGKIVLQDHGDKVYFRNVVIKKL